MGFHNILVALNHSSLDAEIYRQALDLAQAQTAQLMLLHCVDINAIAASTSVSPIVGGTGIGLYPTAAMGVQPVQPLYSADLQQTVQREHQWLETYHQEASERGIPTLIKCCVGKPQDEICEQARAWPADLIMVGRRGRSGLSEVLLGSVSNHVVHHAPCAVLVIQGEEL